MLKFNYYYLLYKLKHRPELWIVKEDINKLNLVKSIENFDSNVEKYYIVEKKYTSGEINMLKEIDFQQFRLFKVDKSCKLVYST